MSEPTNRLEFDHSPPDRSFLAIGGWAVGLLVVIALFFRLGGSGITMNAAPPPTVIAVAPDPAEKPPQVSQAVPNSPLGDDGNVTKVVAGKGQVSVRVLTSSADLNQVLVTGKVINSSDHAVENCKVDVSYLNGAKKEIARGSTELRSRLAPGAWKDFTVTRGFLPGCRSVKVALQDVQFAQ